MPRHATKTSFVKGYKRSKESIEKQIKSMKKQYLLGQRVIPKCVWTKESKEIMINNVRKAKLIKWPIGSKRLHNSRNNKNKYYVIKISDRGKWVYEHRYIMEKFLNRKLMRTEIVHHKNGNSLDNTIHNLEVMSSSEHTKLHHTKKQ